MKFYDKDNIYLCYIKNYKKYNDRKFDLKRGLIYKDMYFSSFLSVSEKGFFDLRTDEYYNSDDIVINVILKINIKSSKKNVKDSKIYKESKKYYNKLLKNL